jgi:hypothetical protein
MKEYLFLLTLAGSPWLMACNNSGSDKNAAEEKVSSESFNIAEIKRCEFEVDTSDIRTFTTYNHRDPTFEEQHATFRFNCAVKNNTSVKLNSFDAYAYIGNYLQ